MTSQKFSSNKLSSKYDLKKAFIGALAPALGLFVAMLYNFYSVVDYVSMYAYVGTGDKIEQKINFFGTLISKKFIGTCFIAVYQESFLVLMLCVIGFLFALFSFTPFMSKRRSNFYFSSPVTRSDMFKNRVIASVTLIAGVFLVGVIAITALNLYFGSNVALIFKLAIAYYFECLIYTLSSFAIFTLAFSLAYTLIEAVVFGVGLYFFPTGIILVIDTFMQLFLPSYSRISVMGLLKFMGGRDPSTFINESLLHEYSYLNPFLLGCNPKASGFRTSILCSTRSTMDGFEIQYTKISLDQITPVILWAVLTAVILVVARYAFTKRRVENAGLHASNKPLNFFIATEIALGASVLVNAFGDLIRVKAYYIFIAILVFAVAFLIAYSVSTRKIKHSKKAFACMGAGVLTLGVFLSVLSLGGFGYSSYIPKADDVEMVTLMSQYISADGMVTFRSDDFEFVPTEYNETGLGIFTDKEDVEKVVNAVKEIRDSEKGKYRSTAYVRYQLKNGRIVYRKYDSLSEKAVKTLYSLTDTKSYKQTQYDFLTGENTSSTDEKANKYNINLWDCFGNIVGDHPDLKTLNESLRYCKVYVSKTASEKVLIKNTKAFRKALAEDLSSATYEEIYLTKVKPVCTVEFSNFELSSYDEDYEIYYPSVEPYTVTYDNSGYFIYPSMTNTINYLNKLGVLDEVEELDSVKSIESVYVNDYETIDEKSDDFVMRTGLFVGGNLMNPEYFFADDNADPIINKVYGVENRVTSEEEIRRIISKSVPSRLITSKDKCVLVKVKDKHNEVKYIPLVMLND